MKRKAHAVGVIFEDADGDILVLKRHQDSPEGNTWGLVGGNIDEGEDSLAAALRETSEEINHSLPSSELTFLKTYHWERPDLDLKFEVYKYKVAKDRVDIRLDIDENTEHMWAQPKNLHERSDLMIGLYRIIEDEYNIVNRQ